MAFREDADALHARIESLERQLEEARATLATLDGVVEERDRLKARLAQLEPEKRPPRVEPPRPVPDFRARPKRVWAPQAMVLGALVAVGLSGLLAYFLATGTSPGGVAGTKPPDTRAPTLGMIDLAATPDPVPIPFTVTGTSAAPGDCRGYLPDDPQLLLRASSPTLVRITTRCDVDLVAFLSGMPTGPLCDDDGGDGTNPMIQATLPAGDFRLAIGTYSEQASASCAIELHALPLPADVEPNGLAPSATPRLASVSLPTPPTAETAYDGQVASAILEGGALQPGCPGFFAPVPDLRLDLAEPMIVRLDASSDTDLVLLLRDPDGGLTCDDDDGMGNSPRIAKRLPPGRYAVWVGTYNAEPAPTAFRATVRLTTLASESQLSVPTLQVSDAAPQHLTGTAGDELSASSMWSDCAVPGYVPFVPSASLELAARRDVTISSGRGDLLLAVVPHQRSAPFVGPPCTTEPAWRGTLDAGSYDLYVGVASGDVTPSAFDLALSASAPSVLPYTP